MDKQSMSETISKVNKYSKNLKVTTFTFSNKLVVIHCSGMKISYQTNILTTTHHTHKSVHLPCITIYYPVRKANKKQSQLCSSKAIVVQLTQEPATTLGKVTVL